LPLPGVYTHMPECFLSHRGVCPLCRWNPNPKWSQGYLPSRDLARSFFERPFRFSPWVSPLPPAPSPGPSHTDRSSKPGHAFLGFLTLKGSRTSFTPAPVEAKFSRACLIVSPHPLLQGAYTPSLHCGASSSIKTVGWFFGFSDIPLRQFLMFQYEFSRIFPEFTPFFFSVASRSGEGNSGPTNSKN